MLVSDSGLNVGGGFDKETAAAVFEVGGMLVVLGGLLEGVEPR